MAEIDKEQAEQAKRLQKLLLDHYEKGLVAGSISAGEVAALQKLLVHNGWNINVNDLPQGVKDKLLSDVDPSKFDDDDADILPLRRNA